jgi:hypothetical protein
MVNEKTKKPLIRIIEKDQNNSSCLNRKNFASTLINEYIVLHGGYNLSNNGVYQDFIIINTAKNKIQHLINFSKIPALANHQMISINDKDLIIFGTKSGGKINKTVYVGQNNNQLTETLFNDEMPVYYLSDILNMDILDDGKTMYYLDHQGKKVKYANHLFRDTKLSKTMLPLKKNFSITKDKENNVYIFGGRTGTLYKLNFRFKQ